MPFLSILRGSLHNIFGKNSSRLYANLYYKDTVIRTARPHKHISRIFGNIDNAEKRAYSTFFKCSMSIEAALALPIFVFAVCILIYPLKIIDAEIRYQVELEKLTGNLSFSDYLEKTASDLIGENISEYSDMISEVITAADVISAADTEILGIPIPTEITLPSEEGEMIRISAGSYVSFPFSEMLNVDGFFVGFISQRRAWTGRTGGAGSAYGETGSNDETDAQEDDIPVWVAENSSVSGRYHLSPECHYISNTVTAVPASSISSLRSADGKKYRPCSSCHPGTDGTVFIFRSGNSYHATEDCKAIQSYVTEITKTEAEERGLSPCAYCLTHYR